MKSKAHIRKWFTLILVFMLLGLPGIPISPVDPAEEEGSGSHPAPPKNGEEIDVGSRSKPAFADLDNNGGPEEEKVIE